MQILSHKSKAKPPNAEEMLLTSASKEQIAYLQNILDQANKCDKEVSDNEKIQRFFWGRIYD